MQILPNSFDCDYDLIIMTAQSAGRDLSSSASELRVDPVHHIEIVAHCFGAANLNILR